MAVAALERTGIETDGFWVEAAAPGDRIQCICLGRHEDHVTVATEEDRFIVMMPDALPDVRRGDPMDFQYEEPQPAVRREASTDLLAAAREAWADIQAVDPETERSRLERAYVETCRGLPAGVREEILRELPERLVTRGREDQCDLEL